MNRSNNMIRKVKTPFGSMYIHVDYDAEGRIIGGSISDPRKEPEAQIAKLVEALSAGLNDALKGLRT